VLVCSPRQRDRRSAAATPCDNDGPRRHRSIRGEGPAQQRNCGYDERCNIQPALCRWWWHSRARFCQPIARKARNDPAANQGNQQEQRDQPEPVAELCRVGNPERVEMHQQIADQQERQRAEHRQIPPVAANDDFACDDSEKCRRKRQIRKRCHRCPDHRGEQNCHAPDCPEKNQRGERPALQGQAAGPIRDRG